MNCLHYINNIASNSTASKRPCIAKLVMRARLRKFLAILSQIPIAQQEIIAYRYVAFRYRIARNYRRITPATGKTVRLGLRGALRKQASADSARMAVVLVLFDCWVNTEDGK
jgi:hypothetical protein